MPFLDALEREGVQMIDYPGGDRIRAVTHYGIEAADIDAAIDGDAPGAGDGGPRAGRSPRRGAGA